LINHAINLASSADAYFYTYYKLRKLAEANPDIHTVLLGYIDDFFLKDGDEYTYGEEYMGNKHPKYCQLISVKDKLFLFFKRPGVFLIATRDAIKQDYILIFKKPGKSYFTLNWGGYLYLTRDKLPKNLALLTGPDIPDKRSGLSSISPLNIRYLKMIADYCNSKKINLIIFRPPLHKFCVRNDEEFANLLKNDIKNVGYLYYSNFSMEDSDYGDLSHLNYKGARKFSNIISLKLNNDSIIAKYSGSNIIK